jgi:hypothetical protein
MFSTLPAFAFYNFRLLDCLPRKHCRNFSGCQRGGDAKTERERKDCCAYDEYQRVFVRRGFGLVLILIRVIFVSHSILSLFRLGEK